MKLYLTTILIFSFVIPCTALIMQIHRDIEHKTLLDKKLAQSGEYLGHQIYAVEKMNDVISAARIGCLFFPKAIPSLVKATDALKKVQDAIWKAMKVQQYYWMKELPAFSKSNAPERGLPNICGITGTLKWNNELVFQFINLDGGSRIINKGGKPAWHYHNPLVLPL